MDDLFPAKAPVQREVRLPELGKTVLFEKLSPRDLGEVNHASMSIVDGKPVFDNRLYDARLVARSIRNADGKRAWKGEQEWRGLAMKIAEKWELADLRIAAKAVMDLSGVSKEAREAMEEALGKGSTETETDG